MSIRKVYLSVFFFSVCCSLRAQVINDSLRAAWNYAGLQNNYLDTSNVVDVTNFGAAANGITNDYAAVTSAINSLGGHSGVVYFPAGNYLIGSTLFLPDSVTLKGAGADVTTLTFNFNGVTGNCIGIQHTQTNTFIPVVSGFSKESTSLVVTNASAFAAGDFAEIRETNGAWDTNPVAWANYSVGQIVKLDSVSGNILYINHPLRIDYDSALNIEIQKIIPRTNVGLECFKITRTDSTATNVNYGIFYSYAANCWMHGIENDHSIGAHVWAEASTSLEITGCYFHHAYIYDGSNTKGYGVVMAVHTGESKIENNIFRHLRHAMMVKQGANGNVYAYNYSIEPTRTEFPSNAGPDISLHGHYAYANLFEGNICQNLMIDQAWGPSGPFNTFFRNRIELYGIIMTSGTVNSDRQNFVGNDITGTGAFQGNYLLAGTNHFTHGNNVLGTIQPIGTNVLPDSSYYLSTVPLFWNIPVAWPNIGTPYTTIGQTIPASQRYLSSTGFTLCQLPMINGINSGADNSFADVSISPSLFHDDITLNITAKSAEVILVKVYDVAGKIILQKQIALTTGSNTVHLTTNEINSGFYLVQVDNGAFPKTFKCLKAY
jgi:hypothetical protein